MLAGSREHSFIFYGHERIFSPIIIISTFIISAENWFFFSVFWIENVEFCGDIFIECLPFLTNLFETNALNWNLTSASKFLFIPIAANTEHSTYANVIVFHAIKNIKKGEEITTSYSTPFRLFPSRDRSFRLNYGFTCDCRLCQLDRNDAHCEERERIVRMCDDISVFSKGGANIGTVTSLLNRVIVFVLFWLLRKIITADFSPLYLLWLQLEKQREKLNTKYIRLRCLRGRNFAQ